MGGTATPSILQGLAPEVEAAINPAPTGPQPTGFNGAQGNTYDSGKAITPATGTRFDSGHPRPPLPPAPENPDGSVTAPDIHPVDKMANSFIDFLTNTLSKNGAGPDAPEHAPGSFGSKLAGAASALGAGLGDMRTGGDPGQGHGWLGAVGATLNARNERLTAEKQRKFENDERLKNDQINLARANMDAVTHARMLQNLDKPLRDAAATSLSSFYGVLSSHGFKVEDHLTKAELDDKMKDPKFASTHTGGITGYEPQLDSKGDVQKDAKGRPIEVPMYSIADIAPGDAAKKLKVDDSLSKKWANAGVDVIPAGTLIPASLAVKLSETARRFGTTLGMLNLGKVQPLPDDVKEQMVDALKSPEVATAMSKAPGNPLAGLYNAQDIVDQHIQAAQKQLAAAQQSGNQQAVQAAQSDLDHAQTTQQHLATTINQGFTDGERNAYLKDKQAEAKQNAKDSKDAAEVEHWQREDRINAYKAEHPNGGVLGTAGGANGDIPISEGMQQQIDQLKQANPTAGAILDHYDNITKAAIMSVAFGDGSVDFKSVFPANIRKGVPGISAREAVSVLKQINPNWSEQQYKAVQTAYKDATTGKNSQAIQQYNNFLQHSSEAVDALGEANRKGPRVWNGALNKLQNAGFGAEATKIQAALSGPRGEIALLLSGGYKPGEAEQKTIDTILSDASTPSQLSGALQQYAMLGTVRLDNINQNYKRVTGKNLPRIIDQKTLDAAKHLGVDPLTYGTLAALDSNGTIFGSQTPAGANAPKVGTVKKFPNGAIGVWDGKGYVAQPAAPAAPRQ
jgi:hypothetical protein